MKKGDEAKVRAYADRGTIAVARVHDIPAAHEIARWLMQQPNNVAIVKMDGIHWIDMETEDTYHARFGDYVVLKPTGFDIVRGED